MNCLIHKKNVLVMECPFLKRTFKPAFPSILGYLKTGSLFNRMMGYMIFFLFLLNHFPIHSQDPSIARKEKQYRSLFGVERLKALNELSEFYQGKNSRKALRYARQAVMLGENIFVSSNTTVDFDERHHQAYAYLLLGKTFYDRENYFDAQENFTDAKTVAALVGNVPYGKEANEYLKKIQAMVASGKIKESFFSRTLGNLKVGEAIGNTTKKLAIQTEVKLGRGREKKGDFQEAIKHYEKAINLLRNEGDAKGIRELQLKVAILLDSLEQHVEAQKFLNEALVGEQSIEEVKTLEILETSPLDSLGGPGRGANQMARASIRDEQQRLRKKAQDLALERDFEQSLAYERRYYELTRKIELDSIKAVVENQQTESEMLLLKQQKEIADLNVREIGQEKERQVRFRNILIFVSVFVLLSTLVTLYFYVSKKKEHKVLTQTHQNLQKTEGKLVDAEKRITSLLKQQLSGDIAQELILHKSSDVGKKCFVCIMFLDIRDFTSTAEKLSPEELISYQNKVFGFMIDIIQRHNGNINQLLGDGFMATFGAPKSHGNDCKNAFIAAQDILLELKHRIEEGVLPELRIGMGLHAGHVVTGNVGNESRKQYSVTGNPVIIASRVEQLNKEYKTQLIITENVYRHLEDRYIPKESLMEVRIKGRTKPIKILKCV